MDTSTETSKPDTQKLPSTVQIGDKVTVEMTVVGIQFTDMNVGCLLKMADGTVLILPADAVKLVPPAPVLSLVGGTESGEPGQAAAAAEKVE